MLFTSHLMSIDSMCRLLRSIFVKCSTENPPTQQFNISHVTKLTNIHINATTNNTATTTAVVTKLPPFKDCHPLATPPPGSSSSTCPGRDWTCGSGAGFSNDGYPSAQQRPKYPHICNNQGPPACKSDTMLTSNLTKLSLEKYLKFYCRDPKIPNKQNKKLKNDAMHF